MRSILHGESHPLSDLFLYLWIEFVYHEVHEDHEEIYNLILRCVLRALRGDISLSHYNLLFLCANALYRLTPFLRGRPPRSSDPSLLDGDGMFLDTGLLTVVNEPWADILTLGW